MSTPQTRERKYWRDLGAIVETVEYYNAFTRRRKDLFGFADLLVLDSKWPKPVLIQVTSGSNHAARVTKIRELGGNAVARWFTILVVSWRKNAKGQWTRREELLSEDDYGDSPTRQAQEQPGDIARNNEAA